jgi:hypothetical protein
VIVADGVMVGVAGQSVAGAGSGSFSCDASLTVSLCAASEFIAAKTGASTSDFMSLATGMRTSSARVSKMRAASFGFIAE